jgi:predicted NUDIX family NTP pyrophosphohydrolase
VRVAVAIHFYSTWTRYTHGVPKKSAGLLAFRDRGDLLEVLLVHPGGPFWAKKDEGAWTIPKGEIADGEEALAAAVREFQEECGATASGEFMALAPIRQAGGKQVFAWAIRMEFDPATLRSNTFNMEWPPKSGRQQEFPEVDRAGWFPIDAARVKILKGQLPLLDELLQMLQFPPAPQME